MSLYDRTKGRGKNPSKLKLRLFEAAFRMAVPRLGKEVLASPTLSHWNTPSLRTSSCGREQCDATSTERMNNVMRPKDPADASLVKRPACTSLSSGAKLCLARDMSLKWGKCNVCFVLRVECPLARAEVANSALAMRHGVVDSSTNPAPSSAKESPSNWCATWIGNSLKSNRRGGHYL